MEGRATKPARRSEWNANTVPRGMSDEQLLDYVMAQAALLEWLVMKSHMLTINANFAYMKDIFEKEMNDR